MQNNWFCKSKEQFTRIASAIHADFSKVCPQAASWKLGPCQMHLFFFQASFYMSQNPTDFPFNHVSEPFTQESEDLWRTWCCWWCSGWCSSWWCSCCGWHCCGWLYSLIICTSTTTTTASRAHATESSSSTIWCSHATGTRFFYCLKDNPSLQAFVSLLLHQTRLELMTDAGIADNVQKMILNLKPLHQHCMMILLLYLILFSSTFFGTCFYWMVMEHIPFWCIWCQSLWGGMCCITCGLLTSSTDSWLAK